MQANFCQNEELGLRVISFPLSTSDINVKLQGTGIPNPGFGTNVTSYILYRPIPVSLKSGRCGQGPERPKPQPPTLYVAPLFHFSSLGYVYSSGGRLVCLAKPFLGTLLCSVRLLHLFRSIGIRGSGGFALLGSQGLRGLLCSWLNLPAS